MEQATHREIEEGYRLLFENNPMPMWVYDLETLRFLAVNEAAINHYGYSRDEFLSMTIKDIRPPEDVPALLEKVTRVIPGIDKSGMWRHRKKDGTIICVEIVSHIVTFTGRPADLVLANDITERIKTEEQLVIEIDKRKSILSALPDLLFQVNPEGVIVDYYAGTPDLLFMPPEQFLNKNMREIHNQEIAEKLFAAMERAKLEKKVQVVGYSGVTLGGETGSFEARISTTSFGDYLIIIRDITEREQAKARLEEAESKYRALAEESLVGVYIIQDEIFRYVNPRFAEIFGYTREEIVDKKNISDLTAPESRALVHENVRRRIAGEISGIHYMFKGLRKDGKEIDLEVYGTRTRYMDRPAIIGTLLDITERKASEDALQQSQDRMATLLETTPSGIVIVDNNGIITYANTAAENILRLSRSQIVGLRYNEPTWQITTPDGKPFPDDRLPFSRVMRSGKAISNIEHAIVHPDGTRIIVSVNAAPLHDGKGQITGVVASLSDVTERHLAEQRRRELEQHKREFYRRTILAATGGKLIIAERSEIEKLAGPSIGTWEINRPEDIARIRHAAVDLAESVGMAETRLYDMSLCIGEACTNALKHAGSGTASLHKLSDAVIFIVSDRGPGIDALVLPDATLRYGYSTAGSMGMGYKAIISMADRVYLATGPTGTTVGIEMKLQPVEVAPSIDSLPCTW